MKTEKIQEIVYSNRQVGSTTWILKSAISQPNCIIVAHNMEHSKYLEEKYFNMLSQSPWYKKLYWKLFGRNHPKFLSTSSRFIGYRLPIIFDNSCFF